LYIKFYTAMAKTDLTVLRSLTTEKYFADIKKTLPEKKPGLKATWKAYTIQPKIENIRYVMIPKTPMELAQVTILFKTKQSLMVHNIKDELVAGSEKPVTINEYLVFERFVHLKEPSDWKICGKLDMNTLVTN